MSVFTSNPVKNPHPLRAQELRGGRKDKSNPKINVRDFVDVEKAVKFLAKRVAAGLGAIHEQPLVDYSLLVRVWQMFLNDQYGDCTCASVAHGLMVAAAMIGIEVTITDSDIERMYEHSGWKPGDASSDQGWTLEGAAQFAQTIGLLGTEANPKPDIDGFAGVSITDEDAQQVAMELFAGLSTGIECPRSALEQFQEGKPWTVVNGSEIAGGHAIWKVKSQLRKSGVFVTWGALAPAEEAWEKTYVDEYVAFVPKDWEAKLPAVLVEAGIVDFSKLKSLVGQYAN